MPKKSIAKTSKKFPKKVSFNPKLTIEVIVAAVAILAFAYFLSTSVFYPQKAQNLKEAMVPAAVPIPAQADYEAQYLQGSKSIGKVHNFGQFETKLIRVGFFKGQFRTDIAVKNAGKETADFFVEKAAVRQSSSTYLYDGGTFNGKNFSPNEERSGYVLYKDVPAGISGSITVVIGNSLGYSTIFNTLSSSPHIYMIEI